MYQEENDELYSFAGGGQRSLVEKLKLRPRRSGAQLVLVQDCEAKVLRACRWDYLAAISLQFLVLISIFFFSI